MQTELHEYVMKNGYSKLEKKLENLETGLLFAELDDTIQFDMMDVSNEEWMLMVPQKAVYTAIVHELKRRLKGLKG